MDHAANFVFPDNISDLTTLSTPWEYSMSNPPGRRPLERNKIVGNRVGRAGSGNFQAVRPSNDRPPFRFFTFHGRRKLRQLPVIRSCREIAARGVRARSNFAELTGLLQSSAGRGT